MAITYTPYKGLDVYLDLSVNTGYYTVMLSPGCTITRSVTKELTLMPVEGGKDAYVWTLGRNENDTIRIDAQGVSSVPLNPDGSEQSPPTIDFQTLLANLKAIDNGYIPDRVRWGDTTLSGRIRSIVVTQRPGMGTLVDVAVVFEVGEDIGTA